MSFWVWIRIIAAIATSILLFSLILELISRGGVGLFIVGVAVTLSVYVISRIDFTPTGERLKTFLLGLEHAGLNVVDFIPEGEWGYRDVTRIKLPAKREHLNLEEFILMAEKHDQDTVYRKRSPSPWGVSTHYIFNQDKTIAWVCYTW